MNPYDEEGGSLPTGELRIRFAFVVEMIDDPDLEAMELAGDLLKRQCLSYFRVVTAEENGVVAAIGVRACSQTQAMRVRPLTDNWENTDVGDDWEQREVTALVTCPLPGDIELAQVADLEAAVERLCTSWRAVQVEWAPLTAAVRGLPVILRHGERPPTQAGRRPAPPNVTEAP